MSDDAPGPITPTRTIKIGDLYGEVFVPSGTPVGVVVITHGYAEHCGRYREVANVITRAGWAALSYDVRGHGQSPGPRGAIDHFRTYLADLTAVLRAARDLVAKDAAIDTPRRPPAALRDPAKPDLSIVLLGHSHGSLITLRALCDSSPPNVVAAIVSSPFLGLRLQVPAYKKLLARVASRLAPNFAQPNALRVEDLTSDKQKQAERVADKLCFDVATARWFTEANDAQQFVATHAGNIKIPTTWLVGGADPIADPSQSRRVADRVGGAHYHDLVGLRHEVFNEVDRGRVFAELTRSLAASRA